ncbi:hypothetical protein L4D08_14615 [Photobacterium chitinilyticum]|uniref:hypothetical protein n=1 Tax=Photobacterium chitinilyticum TaxID=2485123 RepID=UPI003D13D742
MSDFTAIGQYVTEAKNLLDAIKGGAVRVMQTQFDALKASILERGNAAISKIQNDAQMALNQVSTSEEMLNSIGFTALNINDDFSLWTEMNNSRGERQEWPVNMAFYNDSAKYARDLLTPEKISVPSGVAPNLRPTVVQELIEYAGFGGEQFPRGGFNVLKMTANGSSLDKVINLGFAGFNTESYGGLTYMLYVRSPKTNNRWERLIYFMNRHDGGFEGRGFVYHATKFDFEAGDEIYIALPTLTAGYYPAGVLHGLLPNEPRARYHATN